MKTRLIALPAFLGMCFCFGCNNRGEPATQFNKVMEDGGTKLMPIRLAKHDKAILGPAASTEGPATPAQPGTPGAQPAEGGKVAVDDSSAEKAANSFLSILATGSLSQLPEIVVQDQQETAKQLATAAQPLTEAAAELRLAVNEKFRGHAIQIPVPGLALPAVVTMKIEQTNDTEASATLELPGGQPQQLKLRQADGKWRVEMPQTLAGAALALASEQGAQLIAKQVEALKNVTAQITEGKIADAAALEAALKAAVKSSQGGSPGPEPPAGDNAAPAPEPKPSPNAAPQPAPAPAPTNTNTNRPKARQRDEVDETFSGPGMLHTR